MAAMAAVAALFASACGSKPAAPPDVITRDAPGREPVKPVDSTDEDPYSIDAGASLAVDSGCCTVPFALAAREGEAVAQLLFGIATYPMTKVDSTWRVEACVPLATTTYFFQGGYLADDDAGVLWVDRVNDSVPVSLMNTSIAEVNVFDVGEATTCSRFDGGVHGSTWFETDAGFADAGPSDAGVMSADGGTMSTDGGGAVDAGTGGPSQTTVTGACDTLDAPMVLLGASGGQDLDEELTPTAALPFELRLFGATATHFSASANGTLQLFQSGGGVGVSVADNASIPSGGAPNGFIAAMWDDLIGTTTAQLRTQIFGSTGSRHFTVEWKDFSFFYAFPPNERITVQAKLFEGSNAVEVHFCRLDANGGVTTFERGFSSTVGVESFDGQSGLQYQYNAPTLSTATAVRFQ
jgi:hypothetical protein